MSSFIDHISEDIFGNEIIEHILENIPGTYSLISHIISKEFLFNVILSETLDIHIIRYRSIFESSIEISFTQFLTTIVIECTE